jgi:hypothetical protein
MAMGMGDPVATVTGCGELTGSVTGCGVALNVTTSGEPTEIGMGDPVATTTGSGEFVGRVTGWAEPKTTGTLPAAVLMATGIGLKATMACAPPAYGPCT